MAKVGMMCPKIGNEMFKNWVRIGRGPKCPLTWGGIWAKHSGSKARQLGQ